MASCDAEQDLLLSRAFWGRLRFARAVVESKPDGTEEWKVARLA